ncbi:MAG: lipopolysaccharide kinase InaA family protein [Nitrososphaerota archaeon]
MTKKENIVACIEYPVKTRRGIRNELLEIHQAPKTEISTIEDEKSRKLVVSLDVVSKDVEKSEMGEFFASRLLTPFNTRQGEDRIKNLMQKYLKRTILEIIYDAINDYGMGVFRMSFLPEYFLFKKIKARVTLYPPASRIYWWISEASSGLLKKVLRNVEEGLENLCHDGLLTKSDKGYSVNQEVAKRLDMNRLGGALSGIKADSRITHLFKTGKIGVMSPMLLISETVDTPLDEQPIDPDQYVLISTSSGTWALASNQDIQDVLTSYIREGYEKIEITKTGSLFNSTFIAVLRRDSEPARRFFIKRYESWTDVKWVVAKIWAMHLRNFFYSASMRLGNELFFLSYLRENGFNVPYIIHVDWERKIIIEESIDGMDLIRVWTKKQNVKPEEASHRCGETLAKIHRAGIVIGDCKPDNFIIDKNGEVCIVDLEQASFRGDQSWDIAECILYMGHYIDGEELESYTASFVSGYLKAGDQRIVEKALDPRYQFVMMPWTPIWNQMKAVETIRRILKS